MQIDETVKNVLNYVKNSVWLDDTEDEVVLSCGRRAYEEMCAGHTKRKVIYRICGQSGSGKTTQLLAATIKSLNDKARNPIIVAVRNFATYHPLYQELINKYGKNEIRERTNGFALKCLFVALNYMIKAGFEVVYDVTILEPKFEKELCSLLQNAKYNVLYQIMSVSKKQSDIFIKKRCDDKNSAECGRIIFDASKEYFYRSLTKGLKYLIKNDSQSRSIIWTAYDEKPVYDGKLADCYHIFAKNRQKTKKIKHTAESMCQNKYRYLCEIKNF